MLLSLAIRQHMRPGDRRTSKLANHVDLLAGDRMIGFYNTRRRMPGWRRLAGWWRGAYRDKAWITENRPYFVDAAAARLARVRGREKQIYTLWLGTRVPHEEGARLLAAIDRLARTEAPYHLLENNCVSRIADLLAEAEWWPPRRGRDALPGFDRPSLLARLFLDQAADGPVWIARGFLTAAPDGSVLLEP